MKPKIAIVRGKFLNKYEMQLFEPLADDFDITAFGSRTSYHDQFVFPVVKLASPMDLPDFPYKLPILNRMFVDAHYLFGLEKALQGFELVHSAETYFHFTQQCLRAKDKGFVKKVITTVLENIPFNNEGIWGRIQFKKRAREKLDHIIALTALTKKTLLAEGADPDKITQIAHYVDTIQFAPSNTVRRKKKDITILFTGRLEVYKGIFDLLDAFLLLIRNQKLQLRSMKLLIVGDGSQRYAIMHRARELGIIPFIEFCSVRYDDMPNVYRKADIFVAPSKPTPTWQEQYCTALLEAQASGLPIITTNTGGIPENIGNAGTLIEPGDVNALAQAIKELILNPKLRVFYAKKARQRAIRRHDIAIGARKLTALYHSLL